MPPHARRRLVTALALAVAACSDGGTTGTPMPPVITIAGVIDGGAYDDPVTITVTVDRGSYEATLNGAAFVSGRTVDAPGVYVLAVTAHASGQTAQRSVGFEIRLTGSSVLIVRLFNLGANAAGGGGDAILLTDSSAGGQVHGLVDAGPAGANAVDPAFVARRLAALGVDSLAFVALTHAHSDHYAGMIPVLNQAAVARFYYNGQVRSLASYTAALDSAFARADTVIAPTAVAQLVLGRDTATTGVAILPPLPTWIGVDTDSASVLNDGSLGIEVRRGAFRMFLTGDGEVAANQRWRTQFAAFTGGLDVLKVGHHAANDAVFDNGFSGSSAWLAHTAPDVAIASANGTSHPRINATAALLARPGLRTYCTNVHGAIEIRINPQGRYRVDLERNAGDACSPGTDADTQAAGARSPG